MREESVCCLLVAMLFSLQNPLPPVKEAWWTFEENLPALQMMDGCLILNNRDKDDFSGAALVIDDSPELTGHTDGAAGHTSLVIEADFMLESDSGQQMQLVRKTDGDAGYMVYLNAEGAVCFRVSDGTNALFVTSKNRVEADGEWHHVEAVWDSSAGVYNTQLAVDRVVAWAGVSLGPLVDTVGPLTVGGYYRAEGNIGQRFSGRMDNVAVSANRPELLDVSGVPLDEPAVMTGTHLTGQPGFLSMRFVYQDPVTPECHSGTLAQRPDGAIVGAWFGGTREGHIDTGVWSSVFDGSGWSAPEEIAHGTWEDGTQSPTFNPVLFQYPSGGPMLLFYGGGALGNWLGTMRTSQDGGLSWSNPVALPAGNKGAERCPPVLVDGDLLCPGNSGSRLSFQRTDDFGQSWLTPGYSPFNVEVDAIQPAILAHTDGRLQALARSHTGSIVTSWSNDGGVTWSDKEVTDLPNNYSSICAVTLADGRHLLVYNHAGIPEGSWGGPRTPLNVAVSDDGVDWSAVLVLEDEPGEYSYPTVIQAEDGTVHVIYTWNRLRMKHVELNPSAFHLQPIVGGQWPETTP